MTDKEKIIAYIDKLLEKYPRDRFIACNDFEFLNVSSTEFRKGNTNNVDPRVLEYIKTNNLYKK